MHNKLSCRRETARRSALLSPPRLCNIRYLLAFFVCLFICVIACWQLHIETTDQIFMKIVPAMYLLTRKIPFNFVNYLRLNRDLGIVRHFLYCTINHFFNNLANISGKLKDLHENFITDVLFGPKNPIKFSKFYPDLDPRSIRFGGRLRSPSSLV